MGTTPQDAVTQWDAVYGTTVAEQLSWFQARPTTSLRLLTTFCEPGSSVIDVGGGAATLADELGRRGWSDVTVLDVSAEALEVVRARLADRVPAVTLLAADLLSWQPLRCYQAWHDRALYHFLVNPADRHRYRDTVARALAPGGHLILGTFAADGPTHCSGLPTARYEADTLARGFGDSFELVHAEREVHHTPGGAAQPFTWVVLHRVPTAPTPRTRRAIADPSAEGNQSPVAHPP